MNLGENIKKARIKKNLTQEELAEKLSTNNKIGFTTISNWERNYSKPDPDTLFQLCKILEVDANYMFNWIPSDLSEKESIVDSLKKKNFLDENDDLTDEDLMTLIEFGKKNKEFLFKKK